MKRKANEKSLSQHKLVKTTTFLAILIVASMVVSSLGVANIAKKDTTKPQTTTGPLPAYTNHWPSGNSRNILWDNGAPDGMNGLICGEFYGYHAEVIDDVQPDVNWAIGGGDFYTAMYYQNDVQSVNVRVYADDGTGVPTTTLLDVENTLDFTNTWTGNMMWGWLYEEYVNCTFPGIGMPAGSRYWVELQPVSSSYAYWETAAGWGNYIYGAIPEWGYPQWQTSQYLYGGNYNVAFRLFQAPDHDIKVKSIDAPVSGTAYAPITPTTTIQNGGSNDETVDVTMMINSTYTPTPETLMSYGFNDWDGTQFPGWTSYIVSGSYAWVGNDGSSGWPSHAPYEGAWQAYYPSWSASTGSASLLFCNTPLDLSAPNTYQCTFYMYHDTGYSGCPEYVQVYASTDGATWNPIGSPVYRYDGTSGWSLATEDLSSLAGQSTVYIGFYAYSCWGNDMTIDNMAVIVPAGGPTQVTEFSETQTIFVPSGTTYVVTYDDWTPAAWHVVDGGNVQYTCYVAAPLDDAIPSNNYMTTTPTLWYPYFADVAMDAYLSPTGGMGGVYAPTAQITNYGQFAQTFPATLNIGAPYNIDYLFNDFESDNGGFYTNGTEWQYGAGGTGMVPYAYSGSNIWGINTNVGGGYPNSDSQFMWTPVYYSIPANLKLSFQTYLYSEGYYDGFNVKISTDYGATWTLLGAYGAPYNYATLYGLGEPGMGGIYTYWQPVTFDLSAYAGMDVMFQFHFASDSSVTYYGDWIDDFHMYAIGVAAEYTGTTDVTLAPGETQTVSFPDWTPSAYETVDNTYVSYIASGYTALPGDEYTANDACPQVPFSLWYPYRWDVGPSSIISPWADQDGATLPVEFWVANFGSHPCNGVPVECTISTVNGVQYDQTTSVDLPFMGSADIVFPDFTPEELSNGAQGWITYTMTVSTAYQGDLYTANDVMTHVFHLFYPYVQDVGVVSVNSPVGDGIGEPKAVDVTVGAFGASNPPLFSTEVQIGQPYVANTLFYQDFTGYSSLPDGFGTNYPSNWYMDTYGNYAGGAAPELEFSWSPSYVDTMRCWTNAIDTTGYGAAVLSFKMYVNDYNSQYDLAVSTSTDGINWNQVWTVPGGSYPAQTITIPVDGSDGIGSPTFRVAFDFIGDSFNINYWYIDDIQIQAMGVTPEYDQTISGISLSVGQTLDLSFPTWTPQAFSQGLNGDIQYLCLAHTICAGDYDYANDVGASYFTLHYANDVQVKAITSPGAKANAALRGTYYMQPGVVSIAGIIKNVGTYVENGLTCTATISNSTATIYSESIPNIDLALGQEMTVSFPDADLTNYPGMWTLTIALPLGSDANPGDNTKTLQIGVDNKAPLTTYTLNPAVPNGENGWYVSDVTFTLSATDAMSGVFHTYYQINNGTVFLYTSGVKLTQSCYVSYWSVDKVNNTEDKHHFTVSIDKDVPTIVVSKQVFLNRIKFTATCNDTTSGVQRVEWYIGGILQFNDTDGSDGWIYVLHPIPQGTNITATAICYDMAGNSALVENITSQPAPQQQGYTPGEQTYSQNLGLNTE